MLMKVDGLLAEQGPSARHGFSSRSELLWQATYSSDLFVIAAGQDGLYPCTYCTRRLDSRSVGACAPSGDWTGTQAVICAFGALLSLAGDHARRTAQSLEQRSDADVVVVCDLLDSHVNVGSSQHVDIGRTDGNIDETSGGKRTADGLSAGDRVEFRTGQLLR